MYTGDNGMNISVKRRISFYQATGVLGVVNLSLLLVMLLDIFAATRLDTCAVVREVPQIENLYSKMFLSNAAAAGEPDLKKRKGQERSKGGDAALES